MNDSYNYYLSFLFDHKPSIKEIISVIFNKNPNLMDNDREFCHIFYLIAKNNTYTEENLPSYWSICREIFRFKQQNELSAGIKTNQVPLSIKLLNVDMYGIEIPILNKKPTTAKIIEIIWSNYNNFFNNDRLLVQLFDTIAIKNGYSADELPKYWNIIRAAFNYKRGKSLNLDSNEISIQKDDRSLTPIDYRILDIRLSELKINNRVKNRLVKHNILTIKEFLNANFRLNFKDQIEMNNALSVYGITTNVKYSPVAIVTPDLYFKKLKDIFDEQICSILKKYNIRNIGLFAEQFPNILVGDDSFMENPNSFEYIDRISKILETNNINCPIKLSYFQRQELSNPTLNELAEKEYFSEIINVVNSEISALKDKDADVIRKRFGLSEEPRRYTLEEIGKQHGVTRERIRQQESKILKNICKNLNSVLDCLSYQLNQVFEKKQKFIKDNEISNYKNYENLIIEIFDTLPNISFYIDFNLSLIIKKNIQLEELMEDDNTPLNIKFEIERYIYRNYVTIGNKKIKDTKIDILNYFIKTHCRKQTRFLEFQNLYMDFLIKNNLNDRIDLLYDDSTLYNKITSLKNILLSPGKIIRYHSLENIDRLIKMIDLDQYHDIEISSKKIYNDNIELMTEYDIQNEYELHNLLKKHNSNKSIDFSRMPTIKFGNANRERQVLDLLKQLSPISYMDLAKAYNEEYGVDEKTICANYFDCISQYLSNGYYHIEANEISSEKLLKLKTLLNKDFYWKEEIEKICKQSFDNFNANDINSFNMKKINYSVASTCIYSTKYPSLSDYIKSFLSQNVINLNENLKLRSLQTFYANFIQMKNNLDIIEFSPDMYINIQKLFSVGIDKNLLFEYQESIKNFIGDKYFTIQSLKKNGFKYDKLDDLGFDDYFYSSILINDKEIHSKRLSGVYLMKKSKESFDISDFLIYIMGKLRKIDIYDLCNYINDTYGINLNRYKIVAITKECDLYYNQITEKVYMDYDEFYNEI